MADHTALLTSDDFTEEEMDKIDRASNGAARAWSKQMLLELADEMNGQADVERDESEPDEADAQPVLAMAVADPAVAALLERIADLETGIADLKASNAELRVILFTVLSELYAHTGFPDTPEGRKMEREKRAAAMHKIENVIKPSVEAEMARQSRTKH